MLCLKRPKRIQRKIPHEISAKTYKVCVEIVFESKNVFRKEPRESEINQDSHSPYQEKPQIPVAQKYEKYFLRMKKRAPSDLLPQEELMRFLFKIV